MLHDFSHMMLFRNKLSKYYEIYVVHLGNYIDNFFFNFQGLLTEKDIK